MLQPDPSTLGFAMPATNDQRNWFTLLAPGILVAATGVGAGDLLTASIAGSTVGLGILWAALAGALLKWTANEGLARWQMATGTTLLEGWIEKLGWPMQVVFTLYLAIWSLVTGAAMMNACGVGMSAMLPLGNLTTSKIIWGILHSLVGIVLVWLGGFGLFKRLMSVCIAVMFVTVLATAVLVHPNWEVAARAIVGPDFSSESRTWVLAVLGGVGGTVTVLSYGYWIREQGRSGQEGVRACRIDLAAGYLLTGLFGVAMILIGSRTDLAGAKGDAAAFRLADELAKALGPLGELGRWLFLIGFWGAVFSSLLGVWQGVPYLFADYLAICRRVPAAERRTMDFTKTRAYRGYLLAIALLPIPLLWQTVKQIQLTYAVLGAIFMPLLALTLLIMNNRGDWVGREYKSGWLINLLLAATLGFFVYNGWVEIAGR
jgi:Mn2+/Fe2+ NRAMP family transporter